MDEDHVRWARQRLRLMRADPPGLAAKSKARHELLSAALHQFEQLLDASAAVGLAARPLPLFYALSQATRAICAVQLPRDFLLTRHGASLPPAQGVVPLMERKVSPEPHATASFARLSDALRCDRLLEPTDLGALWRALPDLAVPEIPDVKPEWASSFNVRVPSIEQRLKRAEPFIELILGPFDAGTALQAVEAAIARLPALSGFAPIESQPGMPAIVTMGSHYGVVLAKPHSAPLDSMALRAAVLSITGELYEGEPNVQVVLPTLPGGERLAPLALWWGVLFALCSVARYEPDTWYRALNVDRSRVAVPLEDCLSEALRVLPHLVLEALLGDQVRAHTYS